jgi:hypothetical protein
MPKIQSTHNTRPDKAQDGVRLSISPAHKVGNKISSDLPLRRPPCPARNIAGIREARPQVERYTASKRFPQPFFDRTQSNAPLHQLTHDVKRADLRDPCEYTVHSCHVLKGDTEVARETEKCAEQPCVDEKPHLGGRLDLLRSMSVRTAAACMRTYRRLRCSYWIRLHTCCGEFARAHAPGAWSRSGQSEAELADDLPGIAYLDSCTGAAAAEPPGELVQCAQGGCRLTGAGPGSVPRHRAG